MECCVKFCFSWLLGIVVVHVVECFSHGLTITISFFFFFNSFWINLQLWIFLLVSMLQVCLHIVNATTSHWHTKRQSTVETATFGSEFVAARIVTDQIIDLRYTLMYVGVPVRSKSYMFGENKSVVDSASILASTLSKKSTLASYHRVREAIAAGYLQFNWKDGKSNPAEILSKHWEFANIWPLLKSLLFWKGDT